MVAVSKKSKFSSEVDEPSETQIEQVLRHLRKKGKAEKRFDINLREGKVAENLISTLLNGEEKIEVKRDFMVSRTGNVAIETECNGKPSGLSTTESEWWAVVLDGDAYNSEVVVMIKADRLRKLLSSAITKRGGDRNASVMKLLPVETLVKKLGVRK